jgi:thiamine pyrophosphokinase
LRSLVVLGGQWPQGLTSQLLVGVFDFTIIADAGFKHFLEHKLRADAVVGDLDSVAREMIPSSIETLHEQDQSTSDCDKALALALSRGSSRVTLVAWEGGRLDHELAVIQSAVKSGLEVDFISSVQRAYLVNSRFNMDCPGDRICSLIPVSTCENVSLRGVRWELDQASLKPGEFWSLSNVSNGPVSIDIDSGAALFCIETTFEESEKWSISRG